VEVERARLISSTPERRLFILQAPDALAQEFILRGQLSDDGLHAPALLVHQILLLDLEVGLATSQEGRSDRTSAAEGFQVSAPEQLEHQLTLAFGRPAAFAAAAGFQGRVGRPPSSLRAPGKPKARGRTC
jgi:hypothetical protein